MKMLAFIFCLFSISIAKASTIKIHTWSDFAPISDPSVPAPIRAAKKSVFQIWYPMGPVKIYDSTKINIKSFKRADWFKAYQIHVCQVQHFNSCPVMPDTYSGTAFLVRDSFTIATVLHNVQEWIYYAIKYNHNLSPNNILPPIFLTREDQNIVFVNAIDGAQARLSFYNHDPFIFSMPYPWQATSTNLDAEVIFRVSDYVELTLNKKLPGTPLKSSSLGKVSQPLFLVGFPNDTHVLKAIGERDAHSNEISVTVGTRLTKSDLSKINIGISNIGAPGASGSPILNRSGRVVGILYAGSLTTDDGKTQNGSDMLQINKALLKQTWSSVRQLEQSN